MGYPGKAWDIPEEDGISQEVMGNVWGQVYMQCAHREKAPVHFGKAESTRHIPSYHRFSHGFVTDNFPADIFLQSSVLSRIVPDTFQLVLSQTTDKCI